MTVPWGKSCAATTRRRTRGLIFFLTGIGPLDSVSQRLLYSPDLPHHFPKLIRVEGCTVVWPLHLLIEGQVLLNELSAQCDCCDGNLAAYGVIGIANPDIECALGVCIARRFTSAGGQG